MSDIWNYKSVNDIHTIFCKINEYKQIIKAGEQAKEEYAETVNSLMSVPINDSHEGEKLAKKALELARLIQNASDAQSGLQFLEEELRNKYGFLNHAELKQVI